MSERFGMPLLKDTDEALGHQPSVELGLRSCWPQAALLVLLFTVPMAGTAYSSSAQVNLIVALLQLSFSLLFIRELPAMALDFWHRFWVVRFFVTVMIFYAIVAWDLVLASDRSWVYVIQGLFFLSLVIFFRSHGDQALYLFFSAKLFAMLLALMVVALFVAGFVAGLPEELQRTRAVLFQPPIYYNIRLMNYDVFFCIGILLYFSAFGVGGFVRYGATAILILMSYFTFWSAGRGAIVAVFVCIAALAISAAARKHPGRLCVPIGAILIGSALVFITDQAYLWAHQIVVDEGLNRLSTGRIYMWEKSLITLTEIDALWFGWGPDAFRRLSVMGGCCVQAHNVVIQTIMEFGVLGMIGPLTLLAALGLVAGKILLQARQISILVAVAAAFTATLAYSLVSGILYHGLASSVATGFGAFMISRLISDCDAAQRS